jgi:hypothetical protein
MGCRNLDTAPVDRVPQLGDRRVGTLSSGMGITPFGIGVRRAYIGLSIPGTVTEGGARRPVLRPQ